MLDGYVTFDNQGTNTTITKTTYNDIVLQQDGTVINYRRTGEIDFYQPKRQYERFDNGLHSQK